MQNLHAVMMHLEAHLSLLTHTCRDSREVALTNSNVVLCVVSARQALMMRLSQCTASIYTKHQLHP